MQTEQSDVVAPSSVGIADDHLHSLLNTLSALNSEKIAKGHSSNEQAPIIQVLDKKIESTKKSIKDNVDNLIGANKIAMRENLRRINEFKSELSRLPENEMNLKDIQRRFTFNDNIYNYLLQKRTDAAIAMASTVSDKSIVDYPRQIGKAPVAPNNILVILFAIIGGIAVPAAYILGSQLFITKVDSALQLSRWTNIPIVKSLAPVKLNKSEYALNRSGYLAHAFRYIYMQLDKTIPGLKAKVIGVSSAVNGEGKTFCAVNLAYSFVTAGKKTLLIDTDLNKPQLANIFGLNNQKGLADYLTDEDLSHITNTKYEGLDILVAGSKVENASELLLKADFKKLIESLKYKYEAIILDTAPVGLVADYLIISAHTDYTFLIVRQDVSEKDDIENLEEIITQHDLKAGIIYNCDNSINTNKEYYK